MELFEKQRTLVRSLTDDPEGREALQKALIIACDEANVELSVSEMLAVFRQLEDVTSEKQEEEVGNDETE